MSRLLRLVRLLPLGALLGAVACGGSESEGRDSAPAASGEAGAASPSTGGAPAAAGASGVEGAAAGAGAPAAGCHELDPEPNDSRATAVPRETLTDCDDGSATVTGTLGRDDDVDVWEFRGTDTLGCAVNPTAWSDDVLRLCLFADCPGLSFDCVEGFEATDVGRSGCCQLTPGRVQLALECSGTADDSTVWVSVEHDWSIPVSDRDCLDYGAALHY